MKRCEVNDKYKWDLTELYSSFDEWDKDIEKIPKLIDKVRKYKGVILNSANNLYSFYKDSEKAEYLLERLHFYAFLIIDEDLTNARAQKSLNLIEDWIAKYNSEISFAIPEILKSDYSLIEQYLKEKEELKILERHFKEMFRVKEHMLNEKEEAIFSEFNNIANSFKNSSQFIRDKEMDLGTIKDENNNEIKLTPSNLRKYAISKDRRVRKEVSDNENKAYMQSIDSLASNYLGFIKTKEMEAKYRNYPSYLDMKLSMVDIDRNVYESLKSVAKKSKKSFQKYLKLIKDILGVEKLEVYDLSAPLVNFSDKEYGVEEAKKMLLDTFSLFGEEYISILSYAFDNKCIDFMPSDNKVTGWYSAYIPYAKPRVLANYHSKINDISSLAHELGHFVNQYKIVTTQPPQYVYQSSFCAEVSSLNNEIVFANVMMDKEHDKEIKKELLANFIKVFASNFFGAIKQALFEEEAHQKIVNGEGVSSADLCDIWKELNEEFNGSILESKINIGWARIPHFYMNGGYYVYNYSTGIVAACNLANKLLNKEEGIHDKFINYLTIGDSLSPINSLKTLDIKMDTEEPYLVALKMFDEAIEKFYELMND